jgi:hypothetical protein
METTNFDRSYFEYFVFIEYTTVPATPTAAVELTTNTGTPPTDGQMRLL